MKLNEKYSYNSWKRKTFLDVDPVEFNDTEIISTSFYQDDRPYSDVFPKDIRGVTFTNCNLDNCNIPNGAIVNGGTNKHYLKQNDGEYWIVDIDGKPVEPRDANKFDLCGLSKTPNSIPTTPLEEPVTFTSDPERIEQQKISELMLDRERLKQILIDAGELTRRL